MRRLKVIAVFAVYIATLIWAYAAVISPSFAYANYNLYWPGPARLAWIFLLALAPAIFFPIHISRPSLLLTWCLYPGVYIPSIVIPSVSLTLTASDLMPLDFAILICLWLMARVSTVRPLALWRPSLGSKSFWLAVLAVWATCLIFVCAHFNPSAVILNVASLFQGGDEYTIRTAFFDQLSETGRMLGYASGQAGEAIDPFLIAYGLVYRRKLLLIIGVVGQFVLFAVAGNKSILLSAFFLVIIFFLIKRFPQNFAFGLGSLLIVVVLAAAGLDSLSDSVTLSSMTTRRTLSDPGLLTGFYYEHYSQIPHAGLAYHFPKARETVLAPSNEIGRVYFGDASIDANANLWAEGFADFGMPGVLGFTLLLSGILWLFDSIASRKNTELALMLIAMQAIFYSNSAPMTVFITHGGFFTALLLWAVPSPQPILAAKAIEKLRRVPMRPAIILRQPLL